MRSLSEHLKQADSNENFAERLLLSGDPDSIAWAVTAFFYAAVHYGRGVVVTRGVRTVTSHAGFESVFRRHWKASPSLDIFPQYRRLKDESERARYDCVAFTSSDVQALRDTQYKPFRDAIRSALGLPAKP